MQIRAYRLTAPLAAITFAGAVLLAGCGSSDSAATSTTSQAADTTADAGPTTTAAETSTSADDSSTTAVPSSDETTTTVFVPAPTGDELAAVLEAKCNAFGEALKGSIFGLSDVKKIDDPRDVCTWQATGLLQPAVLEVDARVQNSAKSDEKDRELFCADVSVQGSDDPQSNRAKRIAEQVRSPLYFYAAGDEPGSLPTLSTFLKNKDGSGGISLGCDASFAYETRVYTNAPLTYNLAGSALVAAHRG